MTKLFEISTKKVKIQNISSQRYNPFTNGNKIKALIGLQFDAVLFIVFY